MTAQELARVLQKPIEDVYERLVSLEAKDMVRLSYIKGCRKRGIPGHYNAQYQWAMT
jgi:DNA-binding XRE family transcriptional regulator